MFHQNIINNNRVVKMLKIHLINVCAYDCQKPDYLKIKKKKKTFHITKLFNLLECKMHNIYK